MKIGGFLVVAVAKARTEIIAHTLPAASRVETNVSLYLCGYVLCDAFSFLFIIFVTFNIHPSYVVHRQQRRDNTKNELCNENLQIKVGIYTEMKKKWIAIVAL